MSARVAIATFAAAPTAVVSGVVRPVADVVSELIYEADEAAGQALQDELPNDQWGEDPALVPELRIVDAADRPITAARLEREPGTQRFTVVLLTAPADPTLGRDLDTWLRLFTARAERLTRGIAAKVPPFSTSGNADLLRQSLDAIERLAGDPATAAAIRAGLTEEDA